MTLSLLSDKSDPTEWKQYVMLQTTEDLLLWIEVNSKIEQYEICQIVLDEIKLRSE